MQPCGNSRRKRRKKLKTKNRQNTRHSKLGEHLDLPRSSRANPVKWYSTHNKGLCVYGVATISRLLQMIGLFCRISSLLEGSFAKETYNFKEPTTCSHPICIHVAAAGLCVYRVAKTHKIP